MDRNTRIKIRYDYIMEAIGDSNLARKYKHKSNETIYKDLGVKINLNKPIKRKKVWTTRKKKLAETNLEKYKTARELGFTPKEAKKYKRYAKPRITDAKLYQDFLDGKINLTQKERENLWKKWSAPRKKTKKGSLKGHINLPPNVRAKIQELNGKVLFNNKNLPDDASWGFLLVYNEFVEGMDIVESEKIYSPNVYEPYSYNDATSVTIRR